jgi:surface polysaccharide O-acyltransferase-like enzyme
MLYDFLSPVRIALGVSAWLIFVNSFDERWLKTRASGFISSYLAPATLGIYLVHPLFRDLYSVWGFNAAFTPLNATGAELHVLWGIPLMAFLVYVPSVIFTMIVMRLPFVQRIVI